MKFISTRLSSATLSFEDTIFQGLADDGGLYVPDFLPQLDEKKISELKKLNYEELFFEITRYFVGDEIPSDDYKKIIKKSYQNFSHQAVAPLKQISPENFLLELFWGPTLAFKDFALQFLGNLLDYFLQKNGKKIVIIGATSGDTGSAAIQGCAACKNVDIFILHPHQKVSAIQRKQMTTVDAKNVFNLAIEGNFDDCQAMVKKMFADQSFLGGKKMVAINSINFARIMAQIVYYFYAGLRLGADKNPVSFVVPTGNFGDIYAGFLAKRMGLKVNKLVVATNSNDILVRFLENNDYRKDKMVETISPSMNIQVSSNFERLLFDAHKAQKSEEKLASLMSEFERTGTLKVSENVLKEIKKDFAGFSCDDETTKKTIGEIFRKTDEILDPHSAIGVSVAQNFIASPNYNKEIIVTLATAHPAKFPESVIEAGAGKPNLPLFLADLDKREEKFSVLKNDLAEVKQFIAKHS
jgi:threonine synthase